MQEFEISIEQPLFRIPKLFENIPDLIAAESTRHGGVSQSPFYSLNLGGSTQDSSENVAENNRRFFHSLNIQLQQTAKSHQVHGTEILNVKKPGRFDGYDALITNVTGIQLAVTIADCTPILLYDPIKKAVGAVHAGWRGTVGRITAKTVEAMQKNFGTNPADCLAYIGTCIDECSFEVGDDVSQHFDDRYKRWESTKCKYFVDLKLANHSQLIEAGLRGAHIEVSRFSTVLNNEDYFSYRHEKGVTGRMLATIGLKHSL